MTGNLTVSEGAIPRNRNVKLCFIRRACRLVVHPGKLRFRNQYDVYSLTIPHVVNKNSSLNPARRP